MDSDSNGLRPSQANSGNQTVPGKAVSPTQNYISGNPDTIPAQQPNAQSSRNTQPSEGRLRKLIMGKSVKWIILTLIIGPIILFFVFGFLASRVPDGGLVILLLAPEFGIVILIGLIVAAIRAATYVVSPGHAGRNPLKVALAVLLVVMIVVLIGGVGFARIYFRHQKQAIRETSVINQQQIIQLLNECKIDHISQQEGYVQIVFRDGKLPAAADNAGIRYYKTITSDWSSLVAAANQAGKKCGFIEADNLRSTNTWISLSQAQQLLATCQVRDVNTYDVYLNFNGNQDPPTGINTGIELTDYGNNKEIYSNDLMPLKAVVEAARQQCDIPNLSTAI